MAGNNSKDIKKRIKAVQNTQKVTRSMKLLSTIKLQQISKTLANAKYFTKHLMSMIRKVTGGIDEVHEKDVLRPFKSHDSRKVCLVVISSDKGLCGAFNNNIFKYLNKKVTKLKESGKQVKLYLVGKKVDRYVHKFVKNCEVIEAFPNSEYEDRELAWELYERFTEDELECIKVIYTHYVSSIKYETRDFNLMPLKQESFWSLSNEERLAEDAQETIFEPSIEELISRLLPLYLNDRLCEAVGHTRASEMASRVTAMTAATDNAGKLIDELTLKFNKARQAAITQEISEIVVGMESMPA